MQMEMRGSANKEAPDSLGLEVKPSMWSDQCAVWKMSGDSLGTHVRSVCSLEDVR